MNAVAMLASVSFNNISITVAEIDSVSLGWIGRLISWLFDAFGGIYGGVLLGAVCFTLILKTIVLPLDIYSRVKTKKQALTMEEMRPQMEKLKKTYANDQQMYNQKYQELQKQYGYSSMSACLPSLISLVIFFIVFGSFSTYSNYAVLSQYNDLVSVYNSSVETYIMSSEDDTELGHFLLADDNAEGEYKVYYENFVTYWTTSEADGGLGNFASPFEADADGNYNEDVMNSIVISFVRENAQQAVADNYDELCKNSQFVWIGNMWYPDSMLNKVVPSFSTFSSSISRASDGIAANYEESYNEVTAKLEDQKNHYNGYFVLIILAIGMMFLQQFVSMRTQRSTAEMSSLDGKTGRRTNRWMTILMPIIYGVFSFFYSAAFSVYMIVNTTYSLISMLIINKVVAVRFDKRKLQEMDDKNKHKSKAKKTVKSR